MKQSFMNKSAVTCAAIAALFYGTVGVSSAQNQNDAAQEIEDSTSVVVMDEIIVEAPIRRSQEQSVDSPTTKIEIIQLTRRVNFADLDLEKAEDIETLKLRIEKIAKDSCEKLSDLYPLSTSRVTERKQCAKEAIKQTKEQISAAIEAAR